MAPAGERVKPAPAPLQQAQSAMADWEFLKMKQGVATNDWMENNSITTAGLTSSWVPTSVVNYQPAIAYSASSLTGGTKG